MLRKITMFLLVAGLCVQMYPDVSARERDRIPTPVRSSVVHGSIVRAAISDITTWIVAPKEWRGEKITYPRRSGPLDQFPTSGTNDSNETEVCFCRAGYEDLG